MAIIIYPLDMRFVNPIPTYGCIPQAEKNDQYETRKRKKLIFKNSVIIELLALSTVIIK